MNRFLGTLAIIIAFAVLSAASTNKWRIPEFLRGTSWFADPNYSPEFILGPIDLTIPNRVLAFPYRTGEEPVRTQCARQRPLSSNKWRAECVGGNTSGSVQLVLQILVKNREGLATSLSSGVTVLYNYPKRYPHDIVAGVSTERLSIRAPKYDTEQYEAFEDVRLLNIRKDLHKEQEGTEILLRRDGGDPPIIGCDHAAASKDLAEAQCYAWSGFLAGQFERRPNDTYPLSIRFTLPGWALDRAQDMELSIERSLSDFIVK